MREYKENKENKKKKDYKIDKSYWLHIDLSVKLLLLNDSFNLRIYC